LDLGLWFYDKGKIDSPGRVQCTVTVTVSTLFRAVDGLYGVSDPRSQVDGAERPAGDQPVLLYRCIVLINAAYLNSDAAYGLFLVFVLGSRRDRLNEKGDYREKTKRRGL
jgi:hypothetical protein